ncbi:MAG: hypothetical protein GTN81_06395 [Proteobacteria bacterium]|nr:hypothetical protein [Pseudomonadota bacterium]
MGAKKPIECSACKTVCVEVGHAISYPKRVRDPEALTKGRVGHEYRYVCPNCGAEYIYETLSRTISNVPEGADFNIRLVDGEEIIQVNSPHILLFWGLSPEERGIELTTREVRDLQRRSWEIRDRLSSEQLGDEVLVWEQFKLTPEEMRRLLGRNV